MSEPIIASGPGDDLLQINAEAFGGEHQGGKSQAIEFVRDSLEKSLTRYTGRVMIATSVGREIYEVVDGKLVDHRSGQGAGSLRKGVLTLDSAPVSGDMRVTYSPDELNAAPDEPRHPPSSLFLALMTRFEGGK